MTTGYFQRACMVLVLLVFAGALWAEDQVGEVPVHEKNRTGEWTIHAKGLSGPIYLQTLRKYGTDLNRKKNKLRKSLEAGETIVEKEGDSGRFHVVVPPEYRPNVPYGILVFISPTDKGGIPAAYNSVLRKHRLITISADFTGNQRFVPFRHGYAVHAVELLRQRYNIDENRVYISGFSGGAGVGSMVMLMDVEMFDGAILMGSARYYKNLEIAPGQVMPGFWPRPDTKLIDRARESGRYAFVTGPLDMNRLPIQKAYQAYKNDGFAHVKYLEQPRLDHRMPSVNWFEKAVAFLDQSLDKKTNP